MDASTVQEVMEASRASHSQESVGKGKAAHNHSTYNCHDEKWEQNFLRLKAFYVSNHGWKWMRA
jgi:hypothetical protein